MQSLSRLYRLSAFAVSSLLSYPDFTFVTLNLIFLAICIISWESLLIANIGVSMEVYKKVVDLDLLITVNQIQCWKNMVTEQTPHCFFTHTGKDGDCRIYFVPESHLFDKVGNRSMSLENDIMSRSDAENTAEYESDGASKRKYSCEHRTTMHLFNRHGENGDALNYGGDCFERRHSYKEG